MILLYRGFIVLQIELHYSVCNHTLGDCLRKCSQVYVIEGMETQYKILLYAVKVNFYACDLVMQFSRNGPFN